MTSNNSIEETNISLYTKENNRRTVSGYFPLLKYKENLYNSCQTKFSKFLNKSSDIKLLVNNKINEKISSNDYIINSYNNLNENRLTPIPYINKRKSKNNIEKKELKNFQRNVVLMRRLEYTNKINEKKTKKKYNNKISKIIVIQKVVKGYLVRKVIWQINIIKETLANFFYSVRFCIIKKYYHIFKNKIRNKEDLKEIEEKNFNNSNININIYDENTSKNSKNNDHEINKNYRNNNNGNKIQNNKNNKSKDLFFNENEVKKHNKVKKEEIIDGNININEEKYNSNKYLTDLNKKYNHSSIKNKDNNGSIIENDDYIEFSSKQSNTNGKSLNKNNNTKNINSRNDYFNFQLSSCSSLNKLKRAKTQIIQRQFRKYLSKKGYYGHFDKRQIAIIYLIKYMVINSVRPYILRILRSLYKEIVAQKLTQEENYYNMPSERIDILNKNYLAAINEIN